MFLKEIKFDYLKTSDKIVSDIEQCKQIQEDKIAQYVMKELKTSQCC